MTFNLESGYCDLSLALHDEEPRDKISAIEKGLKSAMNRNKRSIPLSRFFR
jgi:hypothetical protein